MYQGTCINECPESTILYNGHCIACGIDFCNTCRVNGDSTNFACIECVAPYILHNQICVAQCPIGYFHNTITNTCQKCSLGCKSCVDALTCSKCKYGFFYYYETGLCVQYCPDAWYADCITETCIECDVSCSVCNGPSSSECFVCADGYILNDSTCILYGTCDVGFYSDTVSGSCVACSILDCVDCSAAHTCVLCQDGYTLKNGACQEQTSETRFILAGSLLETPFGLNYGQTGVYNFANDLDGIAIGTNDLSLSFFVRSLGVTSQLINSYQDSHILEIQNSTFNYSIKFGVQRSVAGVLCYLSFTFNSSTADYTLATACDNIALFSWTFFHISISKSALGVYNLSLSKRVGIAYDTTTNSIDFNSDIDLVDSSKNLNLLTSTTAPFLGYQIAKLMLEISFSLPLY